MPTVKPLVIQSNRTYSVTGLVRDPFSGASVHAGHVVAEKVFGRGRNRQVRWRHLGSDTKGTSRVRYFRLNVSED